MIQKRTFNSDCRPVFHHMFLKNVGKIYDLSIFGDETVSRASYTRLYIDIMALRHCHDGSEGWHSILKKMHFAFSFVLFKTILYLIILSGMIKC